MEVAERKRVVGDLLRSVPRSHDLKGERVSARRQAVEEQGGFARLMPCAFLLNPGSQYLNLSVFGARTGDRT